MARCERRLRRWGAGVGARLRRALRTALKQARTCLAREAAHNRRVARKRAMLENAAWRKRVLAELGGVRARGAWERRWRAWARRRVLEEVLGERPGESIGQSTGESISASTATGAGPAATAQDAPATPEPRLARPDADALQDELQGAPPNEPKPGGFAWLPIPRGPGPRRARRRRGRRTSRTYGTRPIYVTADEMRGLTRGQDCPQRYRPQSHVAQDESETKAREDAANVLRAKVWRAKVWRAEGVP